MKKISHSLACQLVLLVLLIFAAEATAQKKGKIPAAVDKALGGMVYFDSCTFRAGIMDSDLSNVPDFYGQPDTFLLSLWQPKRIVKTEDFFIGETEITNKQYKEFVDWVRDSIAHCMMGHDYVDERGNQRVYWKQPLDWEPGGLLDGMFYEEYNSNKRNLDVRKLAYQFQIYGMSVDGQLNVQELIDGLTTDEKMYPKRSIRIYPDTLSWIRDFSYSYNEPMYRNYFNHPLFDDYPVVGIAWDQAMAYCDWKTAQVNAILSKKGQSTVYIRLPSEGEWESAAIMPYNADAKYSSQYKIYPWNGSSLIDKKGFYKANFGPISDVSGTWLKNFTEKYRFEDEKLNPKKNKKTEESRKKKDFYKKVDYKKHKSDLSEAVYTTKVKSFPAYNGLYDLAGNVAEWTMDDPKPIYHYFYDSLKNEKFAKKIIAKLNIPVGADSLFNYYENNIITADSISFHNFLLTVLLEVEFRLIEENIDLNRPKIDTIKANYDNNESEDIYDRPIIGTDYIKSMIVYKFDPMCKLIWRELQLLKHKGTKKIAKGGSWATGLVHMMTGAEAVYSSAFTKSFVGFRIAFSPAKE